MVNVQPITIPVIGTLFSHHGAQYSLNAPGSTMWIKTKVQEGGKREGVARVKAIFIHKLFMKMNASCETKSFSHVQE